MSFCYYVYSATLCDFKIFNVNMYIIGASPDVLAHVQKDPITIPKMIPFTKFVSFPNIAITFSIQMFQEFYSEYFRTPVFYLKLSTLHP